jgi:anti-sigma regulatory factor (Ser/Thr protein kinase)
MTTTLPLIQTFPAQASALFELRTFVRARAQEAGLPAGPTDDLLIAVTEACNQMLSHEQGSTIFVSWWAHDDLVEINLKDEGADELLGPTSGPKDEGEFATGGLGFPYLLAFVDEYTVRPGTPEDPTTTIRLIKQTSER